MAFLSVLRNPRARSLLWPLVVAGGLLSWELNQRGVLPDPAQDAAVWPATAAAFGPTGNVPAFDLQASGSIPMPAHTPAAHASSLVAMPAGSPAALLAFWFAGQRESAPDVQIAFSWFERASLQWRPASFVLNKEAAGAELGLGVRRLGNPVAWLDAEHRVHLFVVATGLGGWAAGRVLHLVQRGPALQDAAALDGLAFETVGLLPLSWLWNTSHLVRCAPLPLADGGMLLPLYFELGIKYPLAARFDAQGRFVGTQRISSHSGWLQPSLVMQDERHWLALMRDHSPTHKVAVAASDDAGAHWRDLPVLAQDNPDASIAALGLRPGLMVMAHNPSTSGREQLALSASSDGLQWSAIGMLAEGGQGSEYSYPALAWADGALWVSYTDQRQRIAWQRWSVSAAASAPTAGVAPRLEAKP